MIQTLEAPPPAPPLEKAEVEARVRVMKWRQAQACLHQAQAALAQAADSHFTSVKATELIDRLNEAQKEADQAKLDSGAIDKKKDGPLIQQVLAKHAESTWRVSQMGYDERAARQAQQAHERARIDLEMAQSRATVGARNGTIPPPDSLAPHPMAAIPPEVLADWDLQEDEDGNETSPADRANFGPRDRPNTHIQDLEPQGGEPALKPGDSRTRPLNDPVMQKEAQLRDREVENRAARIKATERLNASAAQGEQQDAGPAHGRVENKEGGYDPQQKGAEPKKPGEKK